MVSVGLCIDFLQNPDLEKLSRGSPFVQEFAAGRIPCACSSACPHPLDPPLAHRHPFYSEYRWRAKHLSSRWAPTPPCRCRNLYDVSVIKFCNLMPCSTVFIFILASIHVFCSTLGIYNSNSTDERVVVLAFLHSKLSMLYYMSKISNRLYRAKWTTSAPWNPILKFQKCVTVVFLGQKSVTNYIEPNGWNELAKSTSTFTVVFLATSYSQLDLTWACLDKYFPKATL